MGLRAVGGWLAEARGVSWYMPVLILGTLPERHTQDPSDVFEILPCAPTFAAGQNHGVGHKPCLVPRRWVKGTESLGATSGAVTCAGGGRCCQPASPCPRRWWGQPQVCRAPAGTGAAKTSVQPVPARNQSRVVAASLEERGNKQELLLTPNRMKINLLEST